jgi:hypothetical protein
MVKTPVPLAADGGTSDHEPARLKRSGYAPNCFARSVAGGLCQGEARQGPATGLPLTPPLSNVAYRPVPHFGLAAGVRDVTRWLRLEHPRARHIMAAHRSRNSRPARPMEHPQDRSPGSGKDSCDAACRIRRAPRVGLVLAHPLPRLRATPAGQPLRPQGLSPMAISTI